jgi:hypothetical protein
MAVIIITSRAVLGLDERKVGMETFAIRSSVRRATREIRARFLCREYGGRTSADRSRKHAGACPCSSEQSHYVHLG